MQIAVAAPDVHDERDARLERGDVGEVLLGPDAEIDAALTDPRHELGNDRLVAGFVGQQVVRLELPVRFGHLFGQRPELLVRQPGWQAGLGGLERRASGDERKHREQGGYRRACSKTL